MTARSLRTDDDDATSERRPHVLVVEDNEDYRSLLGEILRERGYDVAEAAHGQEALTHMRARSSAPDVVLLDLMMPVLDGWGVLEAMRADPRLRGITTVVMTASGREAVERLPRELRVLRKPISLPELLEVVRERCAGAG